MYNYSLLVGIITIKILYKYEIIEEHTCTIHVHVLATCTCIHMPYSSYISWVITIGAIWYGSTVAVLLTIVSLIWTRQ